MKTLFTSKKAKTIALSIIITASFVLGIASHDTITRTVSFTKDLFFPAPKVYKAPLSEYEQRTLDTFNSPAHQAVCLAQAKATVSLELVQKYLQETKKQQALANYELPLSLVANTK